MFISLIHCYALRIINFEKKIDNAINDLKQTKLHFPKLISNYLKEKILHNIDDTLTFKYKNLDLEIYNKNINILKVKIIRDIDIWKIKYKFSKLYYEGKTDVNNIFISNKIIDFLEKNKKEIVLFLDNAFTNNKNQIEKNIDKLNKIKGKMDKYNAYFNYFIFNHVKKELSKPPHIIELKGNINLGIPQVIENTSKDFYQNTILVRYLYLNQFKCEKFNFNDENIEFQNIPNKNLKPDQIMHIIESKNKGKQSKNLYPVSLKKYTVKINLDQLYMQLKDNYNQKFLQHV
jgi:hypothetical protein|tara:strand:+ start:55 stop:921 length:867 start_codon:yes stop_codon:yes gene_type:complete